MNNKIHTELAFENAIEEVLLNSGYIQGLASNYNKEFGFDEVLLFQFLKDAQPKKWEKVWAEVKKLYADPYVKNRRGIFRKG